jgi:hypothetical protein
MKKNVLALSITAALIGLTGTASAMTGALDGTSATTALKLSSGGIGHMLLVPYFTAQDTNATLINLTNTDTVNGKAVKVRFRGAANSDDIYDFQVFLSPGDVWTANVSKGADGRAKLTTNDASCTKPSKAVLNATPFVTSRLDSTMTADQKANGTREGYVEIFNMGDIPKAIAGGVLVGDIDNAQINAGVDATAGATVNPLYTAIKHVNKVAPCSGAAWNALDTTNLQWSAAAPVAPALNPRSAGLLPPTTGLMGNWTIINLTNAAAWTGNAVAVQATDGVDGNGYDVPAKGNVVYWPQTGESVLTTDIDSFTADPLLRKTLVAKYDATGAAYVADATPAVTAGFYDLPDFSTPYTTATFATTGPLDQAKLVTAAIAASSVSNELLTDKSIQGSTDWVFSMPTRRYSVAFDYAATISGTDDGRRFTDIVSKLGAPPAVNGFAAGYFLAGNTLVSSTTNGNGRQICTKGITTAPYDREETGVTTTTTVVVSPSTPADPLSFCGEATVLSINNGGILATGTSALKASVAVKDLDVTFTDGWMKISTPSATAVANSVTGLPMLGASFSRAAAGAQGFGVSNAHRFGR